MRCHLLQSIMSLLVNSNYGIQKEHVLAVLDDLITEDLEINRNHHLPLLHLVFPRDPWMQQVYVVLIGTRIYEIKIYYNLTDYITNQRSLRENLAAFYAIHVIHSSQPQKRLVPILMTPAASNRLVTIVNESGNVLMARVFKKVAPHFSLTPFPPFLPSVSDNSSK